MYEIDRYKIEASEDWHQWITKLPFIPFPAGWQVKVIPPFAGAIARFQVKLPDDRVKSIYFDAYDRLGFVGSPYWEVYPVLGDVGRCLMDDVTELLRLIEAPDAEKAES
jgi:hypothetical protein